MERKRDLLSAGSVADGGPRRRRTVVTIGDSANEDREMELKETVRFRDREQVRRMGRDRDISKRRRIENRAAVPQKNGGGGGSYREVVSVDSSDEEYFEEVETWNFQQNMTNQLSPSPDRVGFSTLRSSPVLRVNVDEVLGVAVPRRARSAKKFDEYRNSGSGRFMEDLTGRIFPPSPAAATPFSSGSQPTSSGASMMKKMKPSSTIQDAIEIEVAEALFDLMKQSHYQSQSSERQEKVDRDSTDDNNGDDDSERLRAVRGKDEIDVIKDQNIQSIKGGEGIEEENFADEAAQDGFVDREKVGSLGERESPSCVAKVNACDIQYPTVTKADHGASVVEVGVKKGDRIEIDLMALPSLPSSPERNSVLDIDSGDVEKSETNPDRGTQMEEEKIEVIIVDQSPDLNVQKQRLETSSASKSNTQLQQNLKEPKTQSPTSFVPFSISIGSWPGVLPHPGYVLSHREDLPVEGSSKSSITTQAPEFKFSKPRPKRSATHRYIAENIHSHQQLVQKSLSSGSTNVGTTLYGTQSSNLKSMLPAQRFAIGNPLTGDSVRGQTLAGETSVKFLPQQASSQAQLQARNFLHNPVFTFPPNSSGPSHFAMPSNSSTKKPPPENSSHAEASNAGTFNRTFFPFNEAMIQNNSCQFPNLPNITLPSFKGESILNSSIYSLPVFNIPPYQHLLSTFNTKTVENRTLQMEKNNNGASASDGSASQHPKPKKNNNNNSTQIYPFPIQPMSFGHIGNKQLNAASAPVISFSTMPQNSSIVQMLPELSWNSGGNKNYFPLSEEKSRNAVSSSSSATTTPSSKFKNSGKNAGFHPSHLSPLPIPNYSPLLPKWENFPRTVKLPEGSSQFPARNIPQPKTPQIQVQGHVAYGNSPVLVQGQLPNSTNNKTSSNQRVSTVKS
ncbi:Unknown protein [Striga hermonthica]|uniref:Uncharacterized protein n=1 Tax=Striga hermonthica TaxID=68872 RepID=A0A9N7RIG3_STRHE|nr:Unknown protein [Striga hermonthica]